jgi:hypothetical protein
MPVRAVKSRKGNTTGYKYGSSGKVYRGKGAKAKAARQGRAINARRSR